MKSQNLIKPNQTQKTFDHIKLGSIKIYNSPATRQFQTGTTKVSANSSIILFLLGSSRPQLFNRDNTINYRNRKLCRSK